MIFKSETIQTSFEISENLKLEQQELITVLWFKSLSCIEDSSYDKGEDEEVREYQFEFENKLEELFYVLRLCMYENMISELF